MRYSEIINESINPVRWYHRTTSDRVDAIQKNGLKIDSNTNLTISGDWSFEIYGCRPIFLSNLHDMFYKEHASVLFEVNIVGLPLVEDLPSLVDAGAYYDIDDWSMWFHNSKSEMNFDDLLNPQSRICRQAIRRTKTAACLTDIPPSHLRLLS